MPIEIRQLVIRATVIDEEGEPHGAERTPSGGLPAARRDPKKERERLVAECVEQVLEILREGRER